MVRIQAFLAIEASLGERLVKSWETLVTERRKAIMTAVMAQDWSTAYKIANGLDLSSVYEDNKEYIRYASYAALFFGASRLTKEVKNTVIARGGFNSVIQRGSNNIKLQIEHNAAKQARGALLQELRTIELKFVEQTFKFEEAQHPRDEDGKFTDGGTHTEAFKKWFGDSKVVDKDGNPLRVYHGTKADFAEFTNDTPNRGAMGDSVGFYFSDGAAFASEYGEEGAVVPAYLRMTKPLKLNKFTNARDLAKIFGEDILDIPGMPDRAESYWYFKNGSGYRGRAEDRVGTEMVKRLQAAGYDGVIFPELGHTTYLVFSPNQIKSAIGNKGTFDPNDSDITKDDISTGDLASGGALNPQQGSTYTENGFRKRRRRRRWKELIQLLAKREWDEDAHPREPSGSSEGGQFASGAGRKNVTDTKAFRKWFGKSKVVDEDGLPLVVYHGTQGDFAEFDRTLANPESDLGGGFYFTNQPHDLERNYAGHHGPDFKNKLEQMKEQIAGEYADGAFDEEELTDEQIHQMALDRLSAVHGGASVPVFLKMVNPCYIGGENNTHFDYEENYNEETEEYGEPTGKLVEFIENLRNAASKYDEYGSGGSVDSLIQEILELARDSGGIGAFGIYNLVSTNEEFGYFSDENGKNVSKEIFRQAIQATGFDGFIDTTPEDKFRNMGLAEETTHYVVFEPTQVKSAIGNTKFNPKSSDITKTDIRDYLSKAAGDNSRLAQPFTSFEQEGRGMLQLVSQLHTSRLSAYGFTAEAEVLDIQRYAITEQLDNRICPVCEVMHGREFDVSDARDALDEILDTQDPETLRQLQPWPSQSKAAVEALKGMGDDQIIERNWMIPPFHPWCRGLLVAVGDVPRIEDTPSYREAFGPEEDTLPDATVQTFREYGLQVSQEGARTWNQAVGVQVGQVIAGLVGIDPERLLRAIDKLKDTAMDITRDKVSFKYRGTAFESVGAYTIAMELELVAREMKILTLKVPKGESDVGVALLSSWSNTWEQMGVNSVKLEANVEMGAYAWAKYGWVPSVQDWNVLRKKLASQVGLIDGVSEEAQDVIEIVLASPDPKAIWLLVDLQEEIDGMPVGLALLAGESWVGTLDRTDPVAMARFNLYVNQQT